MEDRDIVALYWQRDQAAIRKSQEKYGGYCRSIARRILPSFQDAEECLNDTWLRAWNAMPGDRPERLGPYLGAITRNLSLSRWETARARKRGGGQTALALEELAECIPAPDGPEQALEEAALRQSLDRFLAGLPPEKRRLFLLRYWYLCPVRQIGARLGMRQSAVKTGLHRLRLALRDHLEREGIEL